jgi:hypothetical protein
MDTCLTYSNSTDVSIINHLTHFYKARQELDMSAAAVRRRAEKFERAP